MTPGMISYLESTLILAEPLCVLKAMCGTQVDRSYLSSAMREAPALREAIARPDALAQLSVSGKVG